MDTPLQRYMEPKLEILPLLEDVIPIVTTESFSDISSYVTPSRR